MIIQHDVEYGKVGDRSLVLDIVRPKEPAAGPLPAVAYFHGGGWNKWDKSTGIGELVPLAATGNYFCVTVGYRLASEALWPAQIHDGKAAIRWLKANAKRLNIDPQRIAVWGGSSGGHMAAELAVTGDLPDLEGDCGSPGQSSRVACCVDYTGPTDLRLLWGGSIGYLFGGRAREMPEVYRQASPVAMVTKDAPPFLIVHGTADTTVPLVHPRALQRPEGGGLDATLFLIDGGEHNAVDQPALCRWSWNSSTSTARKIADLLRNSDARLAGPADGSGLRHLEPHQSRHQDRKVELPGNGLHPGQGPGQRRGRRHVAIAHRGQGNETVITQRAAVQWPATTWAPRRRRAERPRRGGLHGRVQEAPDDAQQEVAADDAENCVA